MSELLQSYSMPLALELHGVSKRFVAGSRGCSASADALRGVDLSVLEGESVALVGDRGAGKSTLLFCAGGLLVPDTGIVKWFGNDRRSSAAARASYYFTGSRAPGRRHPGASRAAHLHLIDGPEALPAETIARLAEWIERRRRGGDAVVIATRDLALARRLTGQVVTMQGGRAHQIAQPSRAARVAERFVGVAPGSGTM